MRELLVAAIWAYFLAKHTPRHWGSNLFRPYMVRVQGNGFKHMTGIRRIIRLSSTTSNGVYIEASPRFQQATGSLHVVHFGDVKDIANLYNIPRCVVRYCIVKYRTSSDG